MFDLIGKRYRGAPGRLSFLSPDIAAFPTEDFIHGATDETLRAYAVALEQDAKVVLAKIQLLAEESGRRAVERLAQGGSDPIA